MKTTDAGETYEGEPWIQSRSGRIITPLYLRPEQVRIEDVSFALSRKTRFTGHTDFYSVAQHCVLGSRALDDEGADLLTSLAFLLHDASEAYLPDIAGPIKHTVMVNGLPFEALENQHLGAIVRATVPEWLVLPLLSAVDSTAVKRMDMAMLELERRHLHREPPKPWGTEGLAVPAMHIGRWGPDFADVCWIARFRVLLQELIDSGGAE